MASASLTQWKAENEAAQERIRTLQAQIEAQHVQMARADERARELKALRSSLLLKHLKNHAEEAEQTQEFDQTRKSIAIAWERIKSLQERNAEVVAQQAREAAFDAHQQAQREEHFKCATKVEKRATLPAQLLEDECAELVSRLRVEDDARAHDEEQARRLAREEAAKAAAAAAAEMAAEAAAAEVAAAEAATQSGDSPTGAGSDAANVESAILEALTVKGQADSKTILHYLREAGGTAHSTAALGERTVERALQHLKEEWQVYEMVPGWYTRF